MQKPVEIHGQPASKGFFSGPVQWIKDLPANGAAQAEQLDFEAAIKKSLAELRSLANRYTGAANDLLQIQIEWLGDDSFLDDVRTAVKSGKPADAAWQQAISEQVSIYRNSGESYLQSRAIDVEDLGERVLRHLHGTPGCVISSPSVLLADDLTPSLFLETDWSNGGAIALSTGSTNSHVALLARARGVPMVVGAGEFPRGFDAAQVDGSSGMITLGGTGSIRNNVPQKREFSAAEVARLLKQCRKTDGSVYELQVNINNLEELAHIEQDWIDGVGLVRTEFLFTNTSQLPNEAEQFEAYKSIVNWASGKPVTFRCFDFGADKPLFGIEEESDKNGFMGRRGIRLLLAFPDVLKTQMRAVCRAAAFGPVRILLPMISLESEVLAASAMLDHTVKELTREKQESAKPLLGIMVEVPVVALSPEHFGGAEFYSVGTNDLAQYVSASSRLLGLSMPTSQETRGALMGMVRGLCDFAKAGGKQVSVCGDLAQDRKAITEFLQSGVTAFSVPASSLAELKLELMRA